MKDVPSIPVPDTSLVSCHNAHTTSVEIRNFGVEVPENTDAVISLKLGVRNNRNLKDVVVLLSPPSAKMIAKDLNRAVKAYLKGKKVKIEDD